MKIIPENVVQPLSVQFKQTAVLEHWFPPELWTLLIEFSGRARINLSVVSKWFYVNVHRCAKNQVDAFIKNSLHDDVVDIPSSEYIGLDSLLPFCNLRDDVAVNFIKLANVYLPTIIFDRPEYQVTLTWFVDNVLGFKGLLITTGMSESKIVKNGLIPFLLAKHFLSILPVVTYSRDVRELAVWLLRKAQQRGYLSASSQLSDYLASTSGNDQLQFNRGATERYFVELFAKDQEQDTVKKLISKLSDIEFGTWIPEFTANYQATKKKLYARLTGGEIKKLTEEIVSQYIRLLHLNFLTVNHEANYHKISQLLEDFPSLVNMVFYSGRLLRTRHPKYSVIRNPTPLHVLALNPTTKLELIELFLNKGANLNGYAFVIFGENSTSVFAQLTAFYLFFAHPIFNDTLLKKMMAAGADPCLRVISRESSSIRLPRIMALKQSIFGKQDDTILREDVLNGFFSKPYNTNLFFRKHPQPELRDLVLPPVRGDNATQEKLHIELYLLAKWCNKRLNNFSLLFSSELVMELSFLVIRSYPDTVLQREVKKLRDDCKANPNETVKNNMLVLLEKYDLQKRIVNVEKQALNAPAFSIIFTMVEELIRIMRLILLVDVMSYLMTQAAPLLGIKPFVLAVSFILMEIYSRLVNLNEPIPFSPVGLFRRANDLAAFFRQPPVRPIFQRDADVQEDLVRRNENDFKPLEYF